MIPKVDLDEELHRGNFTHAWLATYCLDTDFFEHYCLNRYEAFQSCENIVVFLDQRRHDAMLAGVDGEKRPSRAGLHYMLVPVHCAGVFHPKLYLFAGPNEGLLILGSANLTRAGVTRNAEFCIALRYEREKFDRWAALFADAHRFFADVVARRPTSRLQQALAELVTECPWLANAVDGRPRRPRLLSNLERPLWGQLVSALPGELRSWTALSPYFDADPRSALDTMTSAPTLRHATIYTERGSDAIMPATWLEHPAIKSERLELCLTTFGGEHPRRLHAKALALTSTKSAVLAFGSANLSRAAWLATPADGNIETVLRLCDIPADFDFDALMNPLGRRELAELEDLPRVAAPTSVSTAGHVVRLAEAARDAGELVLSASGVPVPHLTLEAELFTAAGSLILRPLRPQSGGVWCASLDAGTITACARATIVVQVRGLAAAGAPFTSNLVVLAQPVSSRDSHQRRLDRELLDALQGPDRFAAVLRELLRRGEDDELVRFLGSFNVVIHGGALPRIQPSTPNQSSEPHALRARRPMLSASLHAAACECLARHIRRVERHAPDLASVPRLMFVARSVAVLACDLVERVLESLSPPGLGRGKPLVITADWWTMIRKFLNNYLGAFSELCGSLERCIEYLVKRHGHTVIAAELGEHAGPLRACARTMMAVPGRIAECRIVVRVSDDRGAQAPFFASDILGVAQWRMWCGRVEAAMNRLS